MLKHTCAICAVLFDCSAETEDECICPMVCIFCDEGEMGC